MMAEGLVMSHPRYGISAYLFGSIQLLEDDSNSKDLKALQVKQNDAIRIVLCKKRKDRTPKEMLIKEIGTKSINQIAAEEVLMELWKAHYFRIDAITENYKTDRGTRHGVKLRTSTDTKSFISKSANLWNSQSEEFRSGKLLPAKARNEAAKAATKLPI